nr:hypothetical protein Iba_chr05dCG15050 [Ipomoea batatas]
MACVWTPIWRVSKATNQTVCSYSNRCRAASSSRLSIYPRNPIVIVIIITICGQVIDGRIVGVHGCAVLWCLPATQPRPPFALAERPFFEMDAS